jgi:two-component system KDP operon response regulator KdpE
VLLVDDGTGFRTGDRRALEALSYEVKVVAGYVEGIHLLDTWPPDVVLLDLPTPTRDGLNAIEQIRTWSDAPIIVLSLTNEEAAKISALGAGADDYLTRPFGFGELNARIRVALRHEFRAECEQPLRLGNLAIDPRRRLVTIGDRVVHLTPIEYALLAELALNVGRVLTHAQLLTRVWGPEHAAKSGYLRPLITSLRKKLGSDLIQTEHGIGYRLNG